MSIFEDYEYKNLMVALEKAYEEAEWQWEYDRMQAALTRDIYYNGEKEDYETEIKDVMQSFFDMSAEDVEKFPVVITRDAMKIINELTPLYNKPPKRSITIGDAVNEDLTQRLNDLYDEIEFNLTCKRVNEGMILHNVQPVRVRMLTDRWDNNSIDITPFSPGLVIAATRPDNYLVPEAVAVQEMSTDNSGQEYVAWIVEDSETIKEFDQNGKSIKTQPNEWGVCRWAFARFQTGSSFWEGMNGDDIINTQIISSILKSCNVEAAVFNGFPLVIATNFNKGIFKRQPRHVINVTDVVESRKSTVDTIDLNFDAENIMKFEQQLKQQMALNRSLPRSVVGMEGENAQSGYQEYLERLPLIEAREGQKAAMRAFEREIFELLIRMSKKDKSIFGGKEMPENAYLTIDYGEVNIMLSPQEKIEIDKEMILQNRTNYVELIMDDNPDLDEEGAFQQYVKNKKLNSLLPKATEADTWQKILKSLEDEEVEPENTGPQPELKTEDVQNEESAEEGKTQEIFPGE